MYVCLVFIKGCDIGINIGEDPSNVWSIGVNEGAATKQREIWVSEKGFHYIREGPNDHQDHGVGNAHFKQA